MRFYKLRRPCDKRAARIMTLLSAAAILLACNGGWTRNPPPAGTNVATPGGHASAHAISHVYHHGVFGWGGHYSWGVRVDFRDKSGGPLEGPYDIAVTGIGGFQPYAINFSFDTTPYRFLVFSLKPTIENQQWHSAFYAVGDQLTGVILNVLEYGPRPVVGQWSTYRIPLGAGGYQLPEGARVLKFMIQDETADQAGSGYQTNKWFVDGIFFAAE